jgi:hypothetical protein
MKLFSFLLVALVSFVPLAHGDQILLDNYEGLDQGTDLTNIIRTPIVGPNDSAGWVSATGSAQANVVIALDGMAANVVVPKEGTFDYLANLKAEYGNESFIVGWDIVINELKSDPGLFAVRFPTPSNSMQILFGFMNDGRLISFNDTPSASSLVGVGTFTANTRYTVSMIYNLKDDIYSVSLNDVSLIVNKPIPTYLDSNSIDRFGFDINQSNVILPDMPLPQGNTYLVDNISFSRSEAVPEPGTLLLLGSGLITFAGLRRKVKNSRREVL